LLFCYCPHFSPSLPKLLPSHGGIQPRLHPKHDKSMSSQLLDSFAQFVDTPTFRAAVPGIVASSFTLVGSMLKDRSRYGQRMRRYEKAEKELAILLSWFQVQQLALSAEQLQQTKVRLSEDSTRIYAELYTAEERRVTRSLTPLTRPTSRVRRLFLLYKPRRARAWIPRIVFYSYLPAPLIPLFTHNVFDALPSLIASFFLASIFWWISVWLEA
jgi:hypothetical protein